MSLSFIFALVLALVLVLVLVAKILLLIGRLAKLGKKRSQIWSCSLGRCRRDVVHLILILVLLLLILLTEHRDRGLQARIDSGGLLRNWCLRNRFVTSKLSEDSFEAGGLRRLRWLILRLWSLRWLRSLWSWLLSIQNLQ